MVSSRFLSGFHQSFGHREADRPAFGNQGLRAGTITEFVDGRATWKEKSSQLLKSYECLQIQF
jgi:hypothetical protein